MNHFSLSTRLKWRLQDLIGSIPDPILKFLNICPCCLSHTMSVERRRTRTAYQDEESNYEISCIDCSNEHDEYWIERWNDYYSQCM